MIVCVALSQLWRASEVCGAFQTTQHVKLGQPGCALIRLGSWLAGPLLVFRYYRELITSWSLNGLQMLIWGHRWWVVNYIVPALIDFHMGHRHLVMVFLVTQVKNWRDKLPSRASNLGPETGSPVHQATSHYQGQTFVSPFFLICWQCSLTIQSTSHWQTTLILCPLGVNRKHLSVRRGVKMVGFTFQY